MSKYPEHDKLHAVQDKSQIIGEFLDDGPYILGEWTEGHGVYRDGFFAPLRKPINTVLAEYFGINQDALEAEKLAMLQEIRSTHTAA